VEGHPRLDPRAASVLPALRDQLRVDLDADAAGPEVTGRRDDQAAVAGAQIVDHVRRPDPGQLEHLVHHLGRGHEKGHVDARMRSARGREEQDDESHDRATFHA
jgi:hypothetical protein